MEIAVLLEDVLVPVAFFAAVVLSLYFYFKTRHQEKMAMIEKGFEFKERNSRPFQALKTGVFFIGIALGLFFGYLMKQYTIIDEVISYFTMILLFGGISLVFNHYITKNLQSQQ
ncbi:MAG: hypothetical protein JXB24_08240 [Bacteroidales bacterium]|nr:hypothetical protein [Bacteroidales bacterium]